MPVVVQDSRKVGMPNGANQTVYTLPDKDALSAQSRYSAFTFIGWSTDMPPQTGNYGNRVYNFYSGNDSREPLDEVTVNGGNTLKLYPIFKQAHWLNFRTAPVGAGASYISPAYVENGQTATSKKTQDPEWRGYKFLFWTTTPTYNVETGEVYSFAEGSEPEPYDFNQTLTDDVTLREKYGL